MYISTFANRAIYILSAVLILLSPMVHGAEQVEDKPVKRVSTLWSNNENCFEDGAFLISIQTYGNSYKVAACSKHGCRISIQEFGKKSHKGDFRQDPKFTWISDKVFETKINGKHIRFYHCLTK